MILLFPSFSLILLLGVYGIGHVEACRSFVTFNSCNGFIYYVKLQSGFYPWQINIWSYSQHKLLHSIETGHSTNIFCTKFVPETSDELVVSGAGDAEVSFQSVIDIEHNNAA